MKSFIKALFRFSGNLISKIINKSNLCLSVYNYIYERSPNFIIHNCVKYISLPQKDFLWTIRLINKKLIMTQIYADNIKTIQFALSYQWHSPALNLTEYILIQFYKADVPWIDVGSNLRLRSLLALSEKRKVYFVEPNQEVNALNIERCKLNNFSTFTLYTAGASNSTGEQQFTIDKTSYCSTIESDLLNSESIHHIETIHTDTIDNMFLNALNSPSGLCIKIDVEGHELQVIEGAKNIICKYLPTLIIEVNDKVIFNHCRLISGILVM